MNDELRQDGGMESSIRGFDQWISYLARDMPFYPGDMVCSGTAMDETPVINGRTDLKLFLKPGDGVEAWVEKIGSMKVRIVGK